VIELSVQDVAQLFETFDPYSFRGPDLDKDAEVLIVGWVANWRPLSATRRSCRYVEYRTLA
jgi:hypothetical protein